LWRDAEHEARIDGVHREREREGEHGATDDADEAQRCRRERKGAVEREADQPTEVVLALAGRAFGALDLDPDRPLAEA
jgi:hypothetical protein